MIQLPITINAYNLNTTLSAIDNRSLDSHSSFVVNASGSSNSTINFYPTVNMNHAFDSASSLNGNSFTNTNASTHANRANLSPDGKFNHIVLDTKNQSNNVVIIDGLTCKVIIVCR